jgi:TPP-dependent pyruvate/acetoin dehydrogenase alpha subunit
MDAEVKAEVQDAYDFADQSPDPEPGALWEDVYAPAGGETR